MPPTQCLAIIGVGLIGGSIGLAARRSGLYAPILGVDADAAALDKAITRGCIDAADELPSAAKRAQIVVVATPVDQIAQHVRLAAACGDALITDTGSTKARILDAVIRAGDPPQFVPAHPLAGSEKRGAEHARANLFDGRLVILTPTARTTASRIAQASAFWESLGGRLYSMSAEEHDRTLAVTSHLPHLLASALAGLLNPNVTGFAATGFRDTTRLASGDPALWGPIFAENAPHVLAALDLFRNRLDDFRHALDNNDAATIHRLLTEAKGIRDDLGN